MRCARHGFALAAGALGSPRGEAAAAGAAVRHRQRRFARARIHLQVPQARSFRDSRRDVCLRCEDSGLRHTAASQAYPSAPIYFALGNNDSGCDDYSETPDSAFLKSAGASFAASVHDPDARASLDASFPRLGDYSVMLPAPMRNTRLIVLQDTFESSHYKGCNGNPSTAPAAQQIAWLHKQLTEARSAGEQVWVMAHIPPGIDVYTTYHRYLFAPGEACNVKQPQMFLSSTALGETIGEFGDVVRLAIFAHTHMDEIKLLRGSDGNLVPAKLVPSISPINGNDPSFMVAQVSPETATIKDYEVYSASNAQGAVWNREYRYSDVYQLPDFSAKSVDAAHHCAHRRQERGRRDQPRVRALFPLRRRHVCCARPAASLAGVQLLSARARPFFIPPLHVPGRGFAAGNCSSDAVNCYDVSLACSP